MKPTWHNAGVLDAVKRMVRSTRPAIQWIGGFDSWTSVEQSSRGYQNDDLIKRIVTSSMAVVAGDAIAERDGVALDCLETDSMLIESLTTLLEEARFKATPFRVLDIGGALGTTYRQAKAILDGSYHLHWTIVEQASLAQIGTERLKSKELDFVSHVTSALLQETDLVYFGSSLCYMENAFEILDLLSATTAETLIIERTPFARDDGGRDHHHRITQQIVDHELLGYNSRGIDSYPCYVFSKTALVKSLLPKWQLVGLQLDSMQPAFDPVHRSLLFSRRT